MITGNGKKALKTGTLLLEYGKSHSNIRSMTSGHVVTGCGHFTCGDYSAAIDSFKRAIAVSVDPVYSHWAYIMQMWAYLLDGQYENALIGAENEKLWSDDVGCGIFARPAHTLVGLALIATGRDMNKGMKILKACHSDWLHNGGRYFSVYLEFMMGNIHLNIVQPSEPIGLGTMCKNLKFIIKNAPFASIRAEKYISKTIQITKEVGAFGVTGHAYLSLGLLYKGKKKIKQARECLAEAIKIFEQFEAEENLKQAKEALASLG